MSAQLCTDKGTITHEGETFHWQAFPHDAYDQPHRDGYSYNPQIDADDPKDVVHMDTTPGTVFTEDDLIGLREYWKLIRARKARP